MCRVHDAQWLAREQRFAAFFNGELLDFWREREEGEFAGAQVLPIRFVRFCAPDYDKVVVISTGRIESYVKYPTVAYDLFQCGYDVMIIDHRGQGFSGRLSLRSRIAIRRLRQRFRSLLATDCPTGRLPQTLCAGALHGRRHSRAVPGGAVVHLPRCARRCSGCGCRCRAG